MARFSVAQTDNEDQVVADMDWEEESYREGCAYARERAITIMDALDYELMRQKPKGWISIGFRERTLATRFGDVPVRRRMYRDADGKTRFPLDECLGLRPKQLASPSLTEGIVAMAADVPPFQVRGRLFRKVAEAVSALTAGELSAKTAHRLLQSVGEEALDEERERWDTQFERGEDVSEGRQRADILYTEADGVWVHLQREDQKHYEVKSGIAYRGWRSVAEDRYALVDKRVYAHASEKIPFWEGACIEWGKQYVLEGVKLFVVGGDGANWIRSGAEEFGNAVFQLDGFHLSHACGRGYGAEIGSAIYDAIRSGSHEYARALISAAMAAETKRAIRDREYVESNMVNGVDWRNRVPNAPPDARSLGTMESNGDKLTANRMKKRGMSWTIRGANRMAKTIQLSRNGELAGFCHRRSVHDPVRGRRCPSARDRSTNRTQASDWADASAPALSGPHSSRPWVAGLRSLLRHDHLLN